MPHKTGYISYPENTDKQVIKREIEDLIEKENPERECFLTRDIRWLDDIPVQDSFEMARQQIYECDIRNGDNLAVRYYTDIAKHEKLKELKEKEKEEAEKYHTALKEAYFKDRKGFVKCEKCGSRISLEQLNKKGRPNVCPVCGQDLRPEKALKHIQKLKTAWKECSGEVKKEEKRLSEKEEDSVRWLIKYEYRI